MNTENLNKLIDNYIASFDIINNEEHQEYYKWEAVKHFKDNFDIDAPDFATMFKESVKLTYNLINNRIVQPTNGIVKLAERPELTEQYSKDSTFWFPPPDYPVFRFLGNKFQKHLFQAGH